LTSGFLDGQANLPGFADRIGMDGTSVPACGSGKKPWGKPEEND